MIKADKDIKYRTIKQVSELLGINSHVIRYWDSKFEGLSTRLHFKKQRFFNSENIKKIQNLKLTLYHNGKHNNSLDLAKRIINQNKKNDISNSLYNFDNTTQKKPLSKKILDEDKLMDIRKSLSKLLDI